MLRKLLIGLAIIINVNSAEARPDTDKMTICYIVKNEQQAQKYPCIATESGGAGTSVLSYQFNGKTYDIVNSYDMEGDKEIFLLNGKPVHGYIRDAFFKKTNDESNKKFFCYKQKNLDFCAQQSN